jgi:transcriptional accessory protein Tex/SPT6
MDFLPGVVKNVVAFGAFVDVGVGHDGLLHVPRTWKISTIACA